MKIYTKILDNILLDCNSCSDLYRKGITRFASGNMRIVRNYPKNITPEMIDKPGLEAEIKKFDQHLLKIYDNTH